MGCGNKGRNEGRNEPQHGAHTQNRLECGRKGQQRNVCGRGRIRGDKGLGSLGGGGRGEGRRTCGLAPDGKVPPCAFARRGGSAAMRSPVSMPGLGRFGVVSEPLTIRAHTFSRLLAGPASPVEG